jgi:serine/threonine protein kinase
VTSSGRAVLADFGLSSVAMDSRIPALSSTTHSGGTTRWQAPEILLGNRNTVASDVYAFAGVCYEVRFKVYSSVTPCQNNISRQIFTEKVPFFDLAEAAAALRIVNGNLPQKLPSISDDVWSLMEECWGTEPGKRPTAEQIVARLSAPPINAAPTNAAPDWQPSYTGGSNG